MNVTHFERAHALRTIRCTSRNGATVTFDVRIEPERVGDRRQWSFYVRPIDPPDDSGEIYYAGAIEINRGLVQLDATKNALPERYHGCCITCALIPVIADHLNSSVRSSRNMPRLPDGTLVRVEQFDEMRSEAAEGVWKRMVREHGARYVAEEDRYYFDLPRE